MSSTMTPMSTTPQQNNGAESPGGTTSNSTTEKSIPIPLCILMPFTGFGPVTATPLPQSQAEKLQIIIKNVTQQQAVVRNNIASLFEHQADLVTSQAKKEASAMGDYNGLYGDDPMGHENRRREVDVMAKRCKVDARYYEEKLDARGCFVEDAPVRNSVDAVKGNGDVEMDGTNGDQNAISKPQQKPATMRSVYQKLSNDLKGLVDKSVKELELYDAHSKNVVGLYRHALDLRCGSLQRNVNIPDLSSSPSVGRTESPVDFARRLLIGMPVVGVTREQQVRRFERLEDLARRGSSRTD